MDVFKIVGNVADEVFFLCTDLCNVVLKSVTDSIKCATNYELNALCVKFVNQCASPSVKNSKLDNKDTKKTKKDVITIEFPIVQAIFKHSPISQILLFLCSFFRFFNESV